MIAEDTLRRHVMAKLHEHWTAGDARGRAEFDATVDSIMTVVRRVLAERDEITQELSQARGRLLSALNIDWSDAPTVELVDDLCAVGGVTPHPFPHRGVCRWCGRDIHKPSAEIGWSTHPDRPEGCPAAPSLGWLHNAHWPSAASSPNGPMVTPVLLCACVATAPLHEVGDASARCMLTGVVAEMARRNSTNPGGADDAPSPSSTSPDN